MPPTPRALVDENLRLFSLPAIALRLNEMVEDPNCSVTEIGETVATDPGLAARVLRLVNSPIYGFSAAVDSIPMAITILGTRQLRDLVLATAVFDSFGEVSHTREELERFWHHSIVCAMAARAIGQRLGLTHVERLFAAGLLHDIGRLVILSALRHDYHQLITRLEESSASEHSAVEREVLGFEHGDIGAELLQQWNLPESLIEPVKYHHHPQQARQFHTDTCIVHLANHIANKLCPMVEREDGVEVATDILQTLTLDPQAVDEITADVDANRSAVIDLLYPARGAASA